MLHATRQPKIHIQYTYSYVHFTWSQPFDAMEELVNKVMHKIDQTPELEKNHRMKKVMPRRKKLYWKCRARVKCLERKTPIRTNQDHGDFESAAIRYMCIAYVFVISSYAPKSEMQMHIISTFFVLIFSLFCSQSHAYCVRCIEWFNWVLNEWIKVQCPNYIPTAQTHTHTRTWRKPLK